MVAASITPTVNTVAAVVAALAALGAVWFARSTVLEAISGRRESREAHHEEMRDLREEREAAAERHEAEMRERASAFAPTSPFGGWRSSRPSRRWCSISSRSRARSTSTLPRRWT
jgi:hypothetical protein